MCPPLTCFLIDDDIEDQEIFEIALNEVDLDVKLVATTDGQRALNLLMEDTDLKPDIIFLDLNMPGMDGKECLIKMRKLSHLETVPIIIYTTSRAPYELEDRLQLDGTHFFSKPNTITELSSGLVAIFQDNFYIR